VASASSLSHEKINLPRHPNDNLRELDPAGKAHRFPPAARHSGKLFGLAAAAWIGTIRDVRQNMPRVQCRNEARRTVPVVRNPGRG
jgi:hypothetical protein